MSVLPGESAAEFAKLHRELVAEWTPNGALEGEPLPPWHAPYGAKKISRRYELQNLPKSGWLEYTAQCFSVVLRRSASIKPISSNELSFKSAAPQKHRRVKSLANLRFGGDG